MNIKVCLIVASVLTLAAASFSAGVFWPVATVAAQSPAKSQRVLFFRPLKEIEPDFNRFSAEELKKIREEDAKNGDVTALWSNSAVDCPTLDLALARGWRVVSVHSSNAGFLVLMEK